MANLSAVKLFADYSKEYGFDQALIKFEIKHSTGERYLRKAKESGRNNVKVLVFDIETAPMEVYAWRCGKQYVSPESIIKDWFVLSWAAKWLCEPDVISDVVTAREAKRRDDKRIIKNVWNLLDKADIIIAHNGKAFDIRKLNARFILNGLSPPLPYQVVDTLIESRKNFAFSSHKLGYQSKQLNVRAKIDTEFQLWVDCVSGDKEALETMDTYCRGDVFGLEDFYFEIRPWIKSHPNIGLFVDTDSPVCPNCGSTELSWAGQYVTMVSRFDAFRCKCGAVGRCRQTSVTKEKRKDLTVSVAR